MRVLVIETASEACSVALFEGDTLVAHDHRVLGRGHAERLVPMIAALPDKGRADRILVSLGPGSFTGVRIGIATARALGFAWGAQVLGYPTLSLVAVPAWHPAQSPKTETETVTETVTVCMNGGHGEWFIQNFLNHQPQSEFRSLSPENAKLACEHDVIVGNRAEDLGAMFAGTKQVLNLLPDARYVPFLPESALTTNLSPIYGRAPDATPQAVLPA